MKWTRRIIPLLLLGLLLPVMAACRSDAPADTTTEKVTTKAPVSRYNFEARGYTGDDLIVRVACIAQSEDNQIRRSLQADPSDGSELSKLIYEREQLLKTEWGLELELVELLGDDEALDALDASLLAGTCSYDLLAGYQYGVMELASKGYLLDLSHMEQYGVDQAYRPLVNHTGWATEYNREINPGGAQFWITGYFALDYAGGMYCTFVNSQLYNQCWEQDVSELVTLALNGEWTVDRMTEMIADFDHYTMKTNSKDSFGLGYEKNGMIDALALGMTAGFAEEFQGKGYILVNSGNMERASQGIHALTKLDSSVEYEDNDGANAMAAFAEGKLLFTINRIGLAEHFITDSDQFKLLPMPKYDSKQTNYITAVDENCTVFGIVYCTDKIEQASAVLSLCKERSFGFALRYYETVLKQSLKRYNDDRKMIELIVSSVKADFGYAWGKSLGDMTRIFRSCEEISVRDLTHMLSGWWDSLDKISGRFATFVTPPEK